ncbi:MAG: hypothetical protein Tsb0020_14670 [Haliangiales bacterium]
MTASPIFTLAFAAALGVAMIVIAARVKVPSIALLLLTGIAVGPSGLGILHPDVLGTGLPFVVGMAVSIILFEGGLTLDLAGARRSPSVIRRMLTLGVLITWLGTTVAVWWLLELTWGMSLLCGSLVIVTGPTVISPLLRRIGVRERLKHILYWEAVLVDAIGVFIAVLCLEWLSPHEGYEAWSPLVRFGARVALGAGVGLVAGALMGLILHYHWVPDEQVNIFVLTFALFTYALCESVLHESGILAVIIAGLIVGMTKPTYIGQLKRFKLELTELAIGMLFVLLAARLDLDAFLDYGWGLILTILIVVFALRPMVILSATLGQPFNLREKLFLSWIAPRGIVAAFMASLFSLELAKYPSLADQAPVLETFTFAIIGTTVILQGLSASWVAKSLGLTAHRPRTWLIVGDVLVADALAGAMRRAGAQAMALAPIDQAEEQHSMSPHLVLADPRDRGLLDDPRFADVGYVLTIAANANFDQLVSERWSEVVGAEHCYQAVIGDDDMSGDRVDETIGIKVWHDAPHPSELLHGLESGRVAIDPIPIQPGDSPDSDSDRFGIHLSPLLSVDEDGDASLWNPDMVPEAGMAIVARRRIPGLDMLVSDAVVVTDEKPSFEQVVEQLLSQALEQEPSLDADAIKDSIIERERSMPTAMGSRVSIPHAYCAELTKSHCFVANVVSGLDTDSPDGEPVHLVFMVLSPVGQAEVHLRSLAALAQLVRDSSYAEMLERQRTGKALLARIHECS